MYILYFICGQWSSDGYIAALNVGVKLLQRTMLICTVLMIMMALVIAVFVLFRARVAFKGYRRIGSIAQSQRSWTCPAAATCPLPMLQFLMLLQLLQLVLL